VKTYIHTPELIVDTPVYIYIYIYIYISCVCVCVYHRLSVNDLMTNDEGRNVV